jgi:hypothetical protein
MDTWTISSLNTEEEERHKGSLTSPKINIEIIFAQKVWVKNAGCLAKFFCE